MATRNERNRLEDAKRQATLHQLMKCARLVNERAMARVNAEARRTVMRPAIASLFPHISLEGTRVGDVARRAGMSKQQAGQLVAELVEEGVVELIPDPEDGRARLVRFTRRGIEAMQQGMAVFRALEAELEARVGTRHFQALRTALPALLEALQEPETAA